MQYLIIEKYLRNMMKKKTNKKIENIFIILN